MLNYYVSVFDLNLKGSDAVERSGLIYSIANQDHPLLTLNTRQYKAISGMLTTVALSVRLVENTNLIKIIP